MGLLLERIHTFADFIQDDEAGGLHLRYLPDARLYYAVRGRILIVTPSRDRLVESLTLPAGEAMGAETVLGGHHHAAAVATCDLKQSALALRDRRVDDIGVCVDAFQVHATWTPGSGLRRW